MRILLAGAEADEKLSAALKHEHILFDVQPTGELLTVPENIYDVIVCFTEKADAKLAGLVRQLRESGSNVPLLVLAGHSTPRARIRLLDAGADNVLMRPCQNDELTAHIRALARRVPQMQSEVLSAGDLSLDKGRCVLQSNTGETRLANKELQLIELFLQHPGQVLPREMLHRKVWGVDKNSAYNNIEVYLTLVRRKLRAVGSRAEIHAERGIGYYMQAG